MRYRLYFKLENEHFPIQYRKNILSFIKLSLKEYSEEYYSKLYNARDNIIKPYTFSVFFKSPKFMNDEILLEDKKFELNISIQKYDIAVVLYNSFNHQKRVKHSLNKNSFILENIIMIPEKDVKDESLSIKFMSPLVVRNRNQETKKDYYYSFSNSEFVDTLKMNIKEQLKITDFPLEIVDSFNMVPVFPKKLVVKFYEKQIECSTGIYTISGDTKLLDYLYKAGMGSKHSSGFGMFEIIN